MSRVAVPFFVTGVALAATEALGVSVTQSLKGSNVSNVYDIQMGNKSIPQQYTDNQKFPVHTRVQLWDATFQLSSDVQCNIYKAQDECQNHLCFWNARVNEGTCGSGCATNLVKLANGGAVSPGGQIFAEPDTPTIITQGTTMQDCSKQAFENILPAGLVTYQNVNNQALVGTASTTWKSRGKWKNFGTNFGGLQISWDCLNVNSTVKDGNTCPMDVQGSGGGGFKRNATQAVWMCAIPRANDATGTFKVGKDLPQCKHFSFTGQSNNNHISPPGASVQNPNGTWPWSPTDDDSKYVTAGVTLVDIVIVNLDDLQ